MQNSHCFYDLIYEPIVIDWLWISSSVKTMSYKDIKSLKKLAV